MRAWDMKWFIKVARIDFGVGLSDPMITKEDLIAGVLADLDKCCSAFEEQCLIENIREEFLEFQAMNEKAS